MFLSFLPLPKELQKLVTELWFDAHLLADEIWLEVDDLHFTRDQWREIVAEFTLRETLLIRESLRWVKDLILWNPLNREMLPPSFPYLP